MAHPPQHESFLAKQHVMFAFRCLKFLPSAYQDQDSNRMTLAYFCLSALSVLPSSAVSSAGAPGTPALEVMLKPAQIEGYREWVYAQQMPEGGFRGSDSLEGALRLDQLSGEGSHGPAIVDLAPANVIQSYTALLALAILGDGFERLDKEALVRFVGACQNANGSFSQFPGDREPPDPRSTYSAFAILSMVNDWGTVDVDAALRFLARCHRHEGGFATQPGLEAQGGTTYCCVASYALASRLSSLPNPRALRRWLVSRQVRPPPVQPDSDDSDEEDESEEGEQVLERDMAGFQGRIGKDTDACYSFWCGAALKLLDPNQTLVKPELDRAWLHKCQHPIYGGIAREPGAPPDVYHSYLALAALSIGGQPGLEELDPAWNCSVKVAARIRKTFGGTARRWNFSRV